MKTNYIYRVWPAILLFLMLGWSCEDYLDQQPEALSSKDEIFTSYVRYQGFVDQMFSYIVDYMNAGNGCSPNMDDFTYTSDNKLVGEFQKGNYWYIHGNQTNFLTNSKGSRQNIWGDGWNGIRQANIAIQNIDMFVTGTENQRNVILGQAYFFRAYFHFNIMRFWGGIPYVDEVLDATDDFRLTWPDTDRRPYFQEAVESVVEDFSKAAELLPADWRENELSNFTGSQGGRPTKGAAYAYMAKALLYAASPLMEYEVSGAYAYNTELCKRSAEAAYKVISLAEDSAVYGLVPWSEYPLLFATTDGNNFSPVNDEWIFGRVKGIWQSRAATIYGLGGLFQPIRWHQEVESPIQVPTQNIVDRFETENGLAIEDDPSYDEATNPWGNRDPRFYINILTNGTQHTGRNMDDNSDGTNGQLIQTYIGGLDYAGINGSISGYLTGKFWPYGYHLINGGGRAGYRMIGYSFRLAEIYLIYAEALNEINNDPKVAPEGFTLSAVEAVNRVRTRVEFSNGTPFPVVNSMYTNNKDDFRERIRNERNVELCFEGRRFDDMRRWHIGHEVENTILYGMEFDKDETYYKRVVLVNRVFAEKHNWLPFTLEMANSYAGFKQNPGW